jgi:hypothetical protein
MIDSNITICTLAKGTQKMNTVCIKLAMWLVVELGRMCGEMMT